MYFYNQINNFTDITSEEYKYNIFKYYCHNEINKINVNIVSVNKIGINIHACKLTIIIFLKFNLIINFKIVCVYTLYIFLIILDTCLQIWQLIPFNKIFKLCFH